MLYLFECNESNSLLTQVSNGRPWLSEPTLNLHYRYYIQYMYKGSIPCLVKPPILSIFSV